MPIFATPQPIAANIEVGLAELRIIASNRTDTTVEVRPKSSSSAPDAKAAEQTRVEFSNGRLLVQGPKQRFHLFRSATIVVTIELPTGSGIVGECGMGSFESSGRLGECRLHMEYGNINIDQAGMLNVNTNYGNVTIDRGEGSANISTGSGSIRIREINGSATIKNGNGKTIIGKVTGELQVNISNGDATVERTLASTSIKSAYGNLRIDEVVRGSILLETAYGKLEVGIREGTAAWLDLNAQNGKIRNSLRAHDGPEESKETAEIRARTGYGNITVQRSTKS